MNFGPERQVSEVADLRDLKQACMFLQTLVGSIDTLMNRCLVPQEDFQHWHARRADLVKFLGKAKLRAYRRERDMAPPPEGDKRLGKPLGLVMGKDNWALRQFRYNDPEKKMVRRENKRQERDAVFNPSKRNEKRGGDGGGFGM